MFKIMLCKSGSNCHGNQPSPILFQPLHGRSILSCLPLTPLLWKRYIEDILCVLLSKKILLRSYHLMADLTCQHKILHSSYDAIKALRSQNDLIRSLVRSFKKFSKIMQAQYLLDLGKIFPDFEIRSYLNLGKILLCQS